MHIHGICGGGRLQIAAQPRETKVSFAEDKHLAGDQEEPASGNRDNRIPNEPDSRKRHFKLPESLPGGVTIDARSLEHLSGNALERGVEAEGHVPHLASEDEED